MYAMSTIKDQNYIKRTPFSDALFVLYKVQILLMLFCYTAVLRFYYSLYSLLCITLSL